MVRILKNPLTTVREIVNHTKFVKLLVLFDRNLSIFEQLELGLGERPNAAAGGKESQHRLSTRNRLI